IPVVPSVGVSTDPNGGAAALGAIVFRVTPIGPAALAVPLSVIAIAPGWEPARPGTNVVEIVNVALPVPEVGDTTSHGWFEDAVHVTVPAPFCVMRTAWAGVAAMNRAPLLTPAKISELRSRCIVG